MTPPVPKPPYPKPPITEGVIHLAVAGPAAEKEIQKLVKRLGQDYPQQEPLSKINLVINTTGGAATVEQRTEGFRLKSTDQADIMVVFLNGIAAARLAPYPGWEYLRDRSQMAWWEWRKTVTFSPLVRIGIRYINRIDVPLQASVIDSEEYVSFTPRVPDFSKKPLNGFWVQATRPTDLEHWSASITSTVISPPPLVDHISLVLDIDVFRTEQIPGREADLWKCVEEVRQLKNSIFESCITDKARKLFA